MTQAEIELVSILRGDPLRWRLLGVVGALNPRGVNCVSFGVPTKEELEHAAMVLEWIRRNDAKTDSQLREYLFKDGSITGHEEEATK